MSRIEVDRTELKVIILALRGIEAEADYHLDLQWIIQFLINIFERRPSN